MGTDDAVAEARRRLEAFGRVEAPLGEAPLYARLALAAAADDELVALLANAPPEQRRGTLFFAAVHFLVLNEPEHRLGLFFCRNPPQEDPVPVFRRFCLERRDRLGELLLTRKTQTNEVQRCSYLVPAFGLVAALTDRPLALIDVGASAGLHLIFDRYFLDYGEAGCLGNPDSPVQITPEIKGTVPVPVPPHMPAAVFRVGIDLAPVDVRDEDAALWLRACVWAEHRQRADLLRRAVEVARRDPPVLMAGDAVEMLPSVLADVPREAALCIFHANTLPYFPPGHIDAFVALLHKVSSERDVYWLPSEGWSLIVPLLNVEEPPRLPGTDYSVLAALVTMEDGRLLPRLLTRAHPQGNWMQWLDEAEGGPGAR